MDRQDDAQADQEGKQDGGEVRAELRAEETLPHPSTVSVTQKGQALRATG